MDYQKSVLPFSVNWNTLPTFFKSLPTFFSLFKVKQNLNLSSDQIADLNKQLANLDGTYGDYDSLYSYSYANALNYNKKLLKILYQNWVMLKLELKVHVRWLDSYQEELLI